MYKGKHLKHEKPSRWNKSKAMLVSLLLVIGVTIGGTLAFLVTSDGPVTNTFTPSQVTTYVDEDVTTVPGTKQNVRIQNTGDTTAYIRAAVVVTWQDANGNVLGEKPVEGEKAEYTIDYQLSTTQGAGCWIEGADGFYYWTSPVLSYDEDADNCYTGVLINSCKAKNSKTIGTGADEVTYYLTVEIIGSGIQSVPTTVVTEEWSSGVSGVSDAGILSIKQQGGAGN